MSESAGTVYRAELEPRRITPGQDLLRRLRATAAFLGSGPGEPFVADIVLASLRTGRELRRLAVRVSDAGTVLSRVQRDLDERSPAEFARVWQLHERHPAGIARLWGLGGRA